MRNSWLICWSCIKLMWGWNRFFQTIQTNCLEAWMSCCVMIFISCLLSVPFLYTTLSLLWKLSLLQPRNFIKGLMKLFSWLKSCISRVRLTASFNSEHFYRIGSWVKWLMRTVSFCSREWRIICLQVFRLHSKSLQIYSICAAVCTYNFAALQKCERSVIQIQTKHQPSAVKNSSEEDTQRLCSELLLSKGCQLIITCNLLTAFRLVNETLSTLYHMIWHSEDDSLISLSCVLWFISDNYAKTDLVSEHQRGSQWYWLYLFSMNERSMQSLIAERYFLLSLCTLSLFTNHRV